MKLWQKLTVAACLLIVGIACASATGRLPLGRTEVLVENHSFDIVDVDVYCDGSKRWSFSHVVSGESERRFVTLERCHVVNLVVEYFASYKQAVVSEDIFGITADNTIRITVGNSAATTSFMVYLHEDL